MLISMDYYIYDKGGWQAYPCIQIYSIIISTVLYFDTNETDDTSDGAFHSRGGGRRNEPIGYIVQVYPYWAGKY